MITSEAKLNLLFGEDVRIDNVGVLKSYKIKDIKEMGFDNYNQNIGILCVDKTDIEEMFDWELEEEVEPFDFIINNCIHGNDDIRNSILDCWKMMFGENVNCSSEGYFYLGEIQEDRIINRDMFYMVIDIIKEQNCIDKKTKKVRPKNEAQKRYLKKRKEIRAKKSQNNNGDSEIFNIISAVCAKHNSYNLFNVQNLTMYQLIEQYKRLCSIDEYYINFESLMHGASSDKVKIKHWSEPMV